MVLGSLLIMREIILLLTVYAFTQYNSVSKTLGTYVLMDGLIIVIVKSLKCKKKTVQKVTSSNHVSSTQQSKTERLLIYHH